jgi:hypothetical protein
MGRDSPVKQSHHPLFQVSAPITAFSAISKYNHGLPWETKHYTCIEAGKGPPLDPYTLPCSITMRLLKITLGINLKRPVRILPLSYPAFVIVNHRSKQCFENSNKHSRRAKCLI